jgi:ABC-type Mn2+/Zn2+ transport system permease subunit
MPVPRRLVLTAKHFARSSRSYGAPSQIGLSIRVSGMLYTFGCLVLPALAVRSVAREMRGMLLLSPILPLVASALGFVLANAYDYPPAQTTVGLLCLALALAWLYRRGRRVWSTA